MGEKGDEEQLNRRRRKRCENGFDPRTIGIPIIAPKLIEQRKEAAASHLSRQNIMIEARGAPHAIDDLSERTSIGVVFDRILPVRGFYGLVILSQGAW